MPINQQLHHRLGGAADQVLLFPLRRDQRNPADRLRLSLLSQKRLLAGLGQLADAVELRLRHQLRHLFRALRQRDRAVPQEVQDGPEVFAAPIY